jgi:DHA2 family multidrug resistance protein-like MFS transporter
LLSADIDAGQRAGLKEWHGPAALVLPAVLLTILFLAIPHLAADLEPSSRIRAERNHG